MQEWDVFEEDVREVSEFVPGKKNMIGTNQQQEGDEEEKRIYIREEDYDLAQFKSK